MTDYTPPPSFTEEVMREVRAHHQLRTADIARTDRIVSSSFFKYALSISAVGLGAVNLLRICFTVFAPAICR